MRVLSIGAIVIALKSNSSAIAETPFRFASVQSDHGEVFNCSVANRILISAPRRALVTSNIFTSQITAKKRPDERKAAIARLGLGNAHS